MKSFAKRIDEKLSRVIRESRSFMMNEEFPAEFNSIGKKYLGKIRDQLNKMDIDIQNSNFHMEEVTSPRDPRLKDQNGAFIITSADGKFADLIYYRNGKNQQTTGAPITSAGGTFNNTSWKKLFADGVKIYFVDIKSNYDVKLNRKEAKRGAVGLDRDKNKQYSHTYWDGDTRWFTRDRYDKSGYRIDPGKYVRMLKEIKANEGGWKKDAEEAIEEYEGYVELIRNIPRNVSKGEFSKFTRSFGSDITRATSNIGYLAEEIENIFAKAKKYDEQKEKAASGDEGDKYMVDYYKRELADATLSLKRARQSAKKYFDSIDK